MLYQRPDVTSAPLATSDGLLAIRTLARSRSTPSPLKRLTPPCPNGSSTIHNLRATSATSTTLSRSSTFTTEHYKKEPFKILPSSDGRPIVERAFAIPFGTVQNIPIVYMGKIDLGIKNNDGVWVQDHKTAFQFGDTFDSQMQQDGGQLGLRMGVEENAPADRTRPRLYHRCGSYPTTEERRYGPGHCPGRRD
jgi:hypothetical protein